MVQKRLFKFIEILQHPRNRSTGDMLRTVIVDKPEMQRPQRTDSDEVTEHFYLHIQFHRCDVQYLYW